MLAYLKGTVQVLQPLKKYVVVVANDVGYKVYVPGAVLGATTPGSVVELYLHHVVREDADDLFGFQQFADLELFEQLISVSGVGPKVALALLSELSAEAIIQALAQGDKAMLTQVSGVGKKIAERLIVELKGIATTSVIAMPSGETQTIVDALTQLGYSAAEIRLVVQELDRTVEIEQQLKQALALLSRG